MNVSLLKGSFSPNDLEKIISELIHVKIKFHEAKIQSSDDEETMKMRRTASSGYRTTLSRVRTYLREAGPVVNVEAHITLSDTHG